MALSDSCFDFLQATAEAAEVLAEAVYHYSAPDYPIPYGTEIDALRRACLAVRQRPYDPEAATELFRLAATVISFHDTPPDTPESAHRETEMKRLIRLLEEPLARLIHDFRGMTTGTFRGCARARAAAAAFFAADRI